MTITNNTDRTGQVTGSGSTGQVVNFNFKIFDTTDVKAYLTASGVVSEISTSDYVVAIDSSGTGCTVTFGGSYTISASNTVQIVRVVPETQTLDLAASGPFPAESVEDALDRVVALTHQSLNDDGTGLVYDADSKRITGVSSATASTDAVNKSQLDAVDSRVAALENESSGASGPSLPSPSGQANNTGLLITSNAYALKSPTEMATGIGLGASDAVTHGQITTSTSRGGNGNLTAVGDVVLGTANSKDVTINDDLVLGVDGTIKPSSGAELGINIDHDQADGTLHIHTASAGTVDANANAKDLVVEGSAADVGMSFLQPDPDGAGATATSRIIFGVDNDNNRSGIHAIHQQAHGGGSAGNDDIMKFRVGAADFVELDKDAAGGTPKMAFTSATKITNVAEDTASSSAATVGQLESVAGQRTLVATFFGPSLNTIGVAGTVNALCKLVNNDGAGESFEVFSPSGVAFASVTEASEKITLQPGTYRIHVEGGGRIVWDNTKAYGPVVCTAAFSGTALAPGNALLDDNGRAFIPRSGLVRSTVISGNGSGNAIDGNLSDIGRAPIQDMIPFSENGNAISPINGIVTLATATDIFLYHVIQRMGSQDITSTNGAVFTMTITKLDGNV